MMGDETTRVTLADATLVEARTTDVVDLGGGEVTTFVATRDRWVEATLDGRPVRLRVHALEWR